MKRKFTRLASFMLACILVFGLVAMPVQAAKLTKPTLKSKNIKKQSVTLKISKVKKATGYRIYWSYSKHSGYSKLMNTKNRTITVKKMVPNTTYYFYSRAYRKVKGKTKLGKKSKVLKVTTKASSTGVGTSSTPTPTPAQEETPAPSPTTAPTTTVASTMTDQQKEVLDSVNKERAKEGLNALTTSDELNNVATVRAKELVQEFSHMRPNESICFTALKEADIIYRYAAENIASGYTTVEDVMDGWMNSSGHRANILSKKAGKIGIGIYRDSSTNKLYWVQVFTD